MATKLTPEQLQDRVAELETENAALREQLNPVPVVPTARELEIRRRLAGGFITRGQAEECVSHQEIADGRRDPKK